MPSYFLFQKRHDQHANALTTAITCSGFIIAAHHRHVNHNIRFRYAVTALPVVWFSITKSGYPIESLVDGEGQITVGTIYPIRCVAIANDAHNSLAMLVRRDGETLAQLLTRLDAAIALAYDEDKFTDEVNVPPPRQTPSRRR